MAVFAYTALGQDGKTTSGTVPAESRAAALAAVRGQGLLPVEIKEQAKGKAAATPSDNIAGRGGRVTQRHVEAFTRELASLLAGGVPLARALHLLRRETKAPGPQRLWGKIYEDVVGGQALADALAQHPRSFSSVYVAMVRAGEAGGFLDVVLSQIAEFRTREQDLKGKVKAALVYPCVLGVLAVGVLIFLLTFFIPRFAPMFKQFGSSLPLITQVIVAVSHAVGSIYGLMVAAVITGLVIAFLRAIKTDGGRRRWERILLRTPGVGVVMGHFALVRFCRMLGTLLNSGVPLVSSLKVAKEAIGNQTLADTVEFGIVEVQRGASLARALGSSDKLFPASVVETIAIAEETGRLDKELVRLAGAYEIELDRQLRMLVALAEPLLLFVMAALIGTVVIGMLLPVMNMSDLMK